MVRAVMQEVYQWRNGAIIGRPTTSWLNASSRCRMAVEIELSYVGNQGRATTGALRRTEHFRWQAGPAGNCPPGQLIPHTTEVTRGHSCRHLCPTRPWIVGRSGGPPGCPLPASRLSNWKLRDQTVSSMPSRLRRRAAPRTPANPVPNSNRVPGSGDATRPVTSARGVAPEGS